MRIATYIKRIFLLVGSLITIGGIVIAGTNIYAAAGRLSLTSAITANSKNSTSNTSSSTSLTTTQKQHLTNIQTKGAAEIARRLTSLNNVATKINSMTELTSSDQSYLTSEVNTEIIGLTALQAQLAADTTVTQASSDAQSIITEYRVYALVLPKVWLVRTADDQQVTESKLSSLAQKLQTQITTDQTAGKNVTSVQTQLNAMLTEITNAEDISNSIEQTVLTLQPSNYDSDHTILSGDAAQLKTAHTDNVAAYNDAKAIVTALKSL